MTEKKKSKVTNLRTGREQVFFAQEEEKAVQTLLKFAMQGKDKEERTDRLQEVVQRIIREGRNL